jgi:hypothetical protein
MADKKGRPLRKVLGVISYNSAHDMPEIKTTTRIPFEVLECGHLQIVKSDIYGEYHAVKRRCRYCAKGKPPHVNIDELKRKGEI